VNYVLTSTETPYVRARYSLRSQLKTLPPRKPAPVALTNVNSGTARDGAIGLTLLNDESVQASQREQGANAALADLEPAATASDVTSELVTTDVMHRSIARVLGVLLNGAREEHFEDGMDSNLSMGLRGLCRNYGADFASVLEERLKRQDVGARILTEILHTLGDIEDDATRDWRLATLADFLKSSSPLVRDAAAVGLSYLDDKKAAPYLREAIERESSKALRDDLRVILEQLGV